MHGEKEIVSVILKFITNHHKIKTIKTQIKCTKFPKNGIISCFIKTRMKTLMKANIHKSEGQTKKDVTIELPCL